MATTSFGGGRSAAAAVAAAKGSAIKAAKNASFILLPCSMLVHLHQRRCGTSASTVSTCPKILGSHARRRDATTVRVRSSRPARCREVLADRWVGGGSARRLLQ